MAHQEDHGLRARCLVAWARCLYAHIASAIRLPPGTTSPIAAYGPSARSEAAIAVTGLKAFIPRREHQRRRAARSGCR
jgi:hypothetical protein